MAKEYYDQKIGPNTDWGGDASTGHKQVKGSRVQEFIKEQLTGLGDADVAAEKKNPSIFGGFVDNVSLKNTDAGSNYVKVVFDTTRHMFFAVTMNGESEQYHRLYDAFGIYNDGEFPNAHPYSGKLYVCDSTIYQWNGTTLECSLISQEAFDAIFPIVDNDSEEEEQNEEP